MFSKYSFGFCPLDLPVFILAVALLAVIVVYNRRFKKKRDALMQAGESRNEE